MTDPQLRDSQSMTEDIDRRIEGGGGATRHGLPKTPKNGVKFAFFIYEESQATFYLVKFALNELPCHEQTEADEFSEFEILF